MSLWACGGPTPRGDSSELGSQAPARPRVHTHTDTAGRGEKASGVRSV